MEKRIKKIFNYIENKPDAILIKNSSEPNIDNNFFYVTNLKKGLFEGCAAVLFADGKTDLIVSELESETAKKVKGDAKIYKDKEEFRDILKNSLKNCSTIGLNYGNISHADFLKLNELFINIEFIDVSDSLIKSRNVKEDDEIELAQKAANIADKIIDKIPEILHEGMYEYELAAEIDYLIMKNGADKPAFETISSFGKNTAEPHYSHGETRLKKGDFVLCDFGACYKKYNSDITRTFVFGKANEKQKRMYKTVIDAQKVGFEAIKVNAEAKLVHMSVENFINKSEFKGCFIHSTGHTLGLYVHDGYGFSPDSNTKLMENMIFTVEPGVYIPGFGGVRIEDDILVKKDGFEFLTKSSRDLIEI